MEFEVIIKKKYIIDSIDKETAIKDAFWRLTKEMSNDYLCEKDFIIVAYNNKERVKDGR